MLSIDILHHRECDYNLQRACLPLTMLPYEAVNLEQRHDCQGGQRMALDMQCICLAQCSAHTLGQLVRISCVRMRSVSQKGCSAAAQHTLLFHMSGRLTACCLSVGCVNC